jgi:hypothetical protein
MSEDYEYEYEYENDDAAQVNRLQPGTACCDCRHHVYVSGVPGQIPEYIFCRKHVRAIPGSVGRGCDDWWPSGRVPRCDECRFYVANKAKKEHDCEIDYGNCHHTANTQKDDTQLLPKNNWYCENWRAR